ncbi:MAG: protein kinase domain-containing protein [Myxococcaceae bacterium]
MAIAADTLVLDGRFKVLSALGTGGMGEVYLGEQVSLGRKVALKVLKQDVSLQPAMLERFKREARLLSSVDHPSVVRVIDFGNEPTGAWLVMELVDGQSLRTALDSGGAFGAERATRLLHQLAEGLAAIHAKGIIHRDLKPENVVLSSSGRTEQARLLDFGIARLVEPEAQDPSISQTGLVLGTPEYVSPEQAMGHALDARSDIYSFGVLAYRTLAGRLPFDGPGPRQYLAQHVTSAPKRLDEANPALLAHPELCDVVMRCLEKEPAARFQTADELATAFERLRVMVSGAHAAVVRTTSSASNPKVPAAVVDGPPASPVPVSGPSGTAVFGAPAAESAETEQGGSFATPAPTRPRLALRTKIAVAVVAGVLLVTGGLLLSARDSTAELVRSALSEKHPKEALQIIELAEKQKKKSPELSQLKAAALHQMESHEAEFAIVRQLGDDLKTPEPELLTALAAHYGIGSYKSDVAEALARVPKDALQHGFEEVSEHPAGWDQYGAVRYLDRVSKSLDGKARTKAYAKTLQSTDCDLREQAIKRLEELKDPSAIDALEALRPVKREGVGGALMDMVNDCGVGDAKDAAAKLRALNKGR